MIFGPTLTKVSIIGGGGCNTAYSDIPHDVASVKQAMKLIGEYELKTTKRRLGKEVRIYKQLRWLFI
jgi:hypothetical protein